MGRARATQALGFLMRGRALAGQTVKSGAIVLCAWILWAHWAGGLVRQPGGGLYNPREYQVVGAYESPAECEKARRETQLGQGYDRALCLPDSVKPQ
jgi:hypothetical protein